MFSRPPNKKFPNRSTHQMIQVLTPVVTPVDEAAKAVVDKTTRLSLVDDTASPVVPSLLPSSAPSNNSASSVLVSHPSKTPSSSDTIPLNNATPSSSSSGGNRRRNHSNQEFMPTTNRTTSGTHHLQDTQQVVTNNNNNGPTSESGSASGGGQNLHHKNFKGRGPKDRMNKRREGDARVNDRSRKETSPRTTTKSSSFDLEATAFPPLPGVITCSPVVVETSSSVKKEAPPTTSDPVSLAVNGNGCLADVVKGVSSRKDCVWNRTSNDTSSGSTGTEREERTSSPVSGFNGCDKNLQENPSQSKGEEKKDVVPAAQSSVPVIQTNQEEGSIQSSVSNNSSDTCNGHVSETESVSDSCSSGKILSYCDVARKAREKTEEKREEIIGTDTQSPTSKTNRKNLLIIHCDCFTNEMSCMSTDDSAFNSESEARVESTSGASSDKEWKEKRRDRKERKESDSRPSSRHSLQGNKSYSRNK